MNNPNSRLSAAIAAYPHLSVMDAARCLIRPDITPASSFDLLMHVIRQAFFSGGPDLVLAFIQTLDDIGLYDEDLIRLINKAEGGAPLVGCVVNAVKLGVMSKEEALRIVDDPTETFDIVALNSRVETELRKRYPNFEEIAEDVQNTVAEFQRELPSPPDDEGGADPSRN